MFREKLIAILLEGNKDTPDNPTYMTAKMLDEIVESARKDRISLARLCLIIGTVLGFLIGFFI